MEEFPELYELAGFFETEPHISERDVPWFYNRLTYRTERGNEKIYCAIEPGYGKMVVIWERGEDLVASLNLENITALKVTSHKGSEFITANFKPSSGILEFEFQLKPTMHIKWGNERRV